MKTIPTEPTADQCSNGVRISDVGEYPAFACWYPQMGGYVGKCVITFEIEPKTFDYCFDAWVWHNGEFPFKEGNPVHIHHCCPLHFVEFGNFVNEKQRELA